MAGLKSRQRPGEGAQERTPSKIFGSWFAVILSSLCGIALAFHFHYKVPLPANHHGFNSEGVSDFSEHNAVNIISHLSDNIGYSKSCFETRKRENIIDKFCNLKELWVHLKRNNLMIT